MVKLVHTLLNELNQPCIQQANKRTLKNNIMENTFKNALKYVRHLDNTNNGWSESEITLASAMTSYAKKITNKKLLNNCSFCKSEKVFDVFFNKYACPICENVKQSGNN